MAMSFISLSARSSKMAGGWRAIVLGVALTTATVGCATIAARAVTNVALVDPGQRHAATTAVKLLHERPSEAHKVIAYLETMGNEYVNSEVFLLENMREKAKTIGADAIVVRGHGRSTVRGNDFIQLLEGEAIKFKP